MLSDRDARAMATLTAGQVLARALSFAFFLVVAHRFAPAGFGEVRYTVTIAWATFAPLQVLATAATRELGAARVGGQQRQAVLGTTLAATAALATIMVAAIVALNGLGAFGTANGTGLAVVLAGNAVVVVYVALCRGVGRYRRAVAVDVGQAAVQLAAFAVLAAVADPSPLDALLIFGASSVLPVVWAELRDDGLLRGLGTDRVVARRLLRLGAPLLVTEGLFLAWMTADQAWVSAELGRVELGLYGAAKTAVMVGLVVPNGVSGVLTPRMAELRASGDEGAARRLLAEATGGVFAIALVTLALTVVLAPTIMRVAFGEPYAAAAPVLRILGVGFVFYCAFAVLFAGAVALERPGWTVVAVAVAVAVELVGLLAWASTVDQAAFAYVLSALAALLCLAALVATDGGRPRRAGGLPWAP